MLAFISIDVSVSHLSEDTRFRPTATVVCVYVTHYFDAVNMINQSLRSLCGASVMDFCWVETLLFPAVTSTSFHVECNF